MQFSRILLFVLTLIFLKSRDGRRGVVGLMAAFGLRTCQKELRRPGRLSFSFASVHSEKNGHLALPAIDAEIPSRIGFGPLRDVHKINAGLPPDARLPADYYSVAKYVHPPKTPQRDVSKVSEAKYENH